MLTTKPVWPSWILPGLGDERLLVIPFDAPKPQLYTLLPPMFIYGYLQRWLRDVDSRRVLIDIHATLFGKLALSGWAYDEVEQKLRPDLWRAFDRRDLLVLFPRRSYVPPPGLDVPPSTPPPPEQKKTWIEIVLLDSDEKPVANASYRITLPSGEKRTGQLDAKGFVRIDGIDPSGKCDVEFPEIDGREWGPTKLPKG